MQWPAGADVVRIKSHTFILKHCFDSVTPERSVIIFSLEITFPSSSLSLPKPLRSFHHQQSSLALAYHTHRSCCFTPSQLPQYELSSLCILSKSERERRNTRSIRNLAIMFGAQFPLLYGRQNLRRPAFCTTPIMPSNQNQRKLLYSTLLFYAILVLVFVLSSHSTMQDHPY